MSNPVFNAMGRGNSGGMLQAFGQFMNQHRGQNPNEMIQQMLQSGRLNQDQLNQAQQAAQRMSQQFDGMRQMFGF